MTNTGKEFMGVPLDHVRRGLDYGGYQTAKDMAAEEFLKLAPVAEKLFDAVQKGLDQHYSVMDSWEAMHQALAAYRELMEKD